MIYHNSKNLEKIKVNDVVYFNKLPYRIDSYSGGYYLEHTDSNGNKNILYHLKFLNQLKYVRKFNCDLYGGPQNIVSKNLESMFNLIKDILEITEKIKNEL